MPVKKERRVPVAHHDPDELALIRRQIALSRDVLERFADLAEEARGIFKRVYALEEIIDEWFSESAETINQLSKQIDRLERLMLLDKTGQQASLEALGLKEDIRDEQDKKILQTLLAQETDNLNKLRVREAKYGGEAPVWLLNQIEETQERIAGIRTQLK